jgi:hypothetical protein
MIEKIEPTITSSTKKTSMTRSGVPNMCMMREVSSD